MQQFKVKVLRTVVQTVDIEIWADSSEQAQEKVALRDYPEEAETVRDTNFEKENVIATFERR